MKKYTKLYVIIFSPFPGNLQSTIFFSLASRRPHSCCLESAATSSVKKADCPEFRRMIQCGILNEMFIHPRRKKKIENKIYIKTKGRRKGGRSLERPLLMYKIQKTLIAIRPGEKPRTKSRW
jgi:hypothetical protein